MIELLAKDQFVDALMNEELRLRIRQNRPVTLRQALEAALEMESYQLASQRHIKSVRGAAITVEGEQEEDTESSASQKKPPWVDGLRCIQRSLEKNQPATASQGSQGSVARSRSRGVCRKCGKPGHIQRNCTAVVREAGETSASRNSGNEQQPSLRG